MGVWKSLQIDGKIFIRRIVQQPDDTVTLWISDFRSIYKEQLRLADLQARSKAANPIVEFEPHTVLETILNADADQRGFGAENGEVSVFRFQCKYYVSQLPFHFHWLLERQSEEVFYEEITKSLMTSLLGAQMQRSQLLDTIAAKDVEIEQYKLDGAELTRKHLATVAFDREAFEESTKSVDALADVVQMESDALRLRVNSSVPKQPSSDCVDQPATKKRASASPTKPTKRMTKELLARSKFHSGPNVSMVYGEDDDNDGEVDDTPSTLNSKKTIRNSTNARRVKTKLNL